MVPYYGWEILTLLPDFQIKNYMARRENFHMRKVLSWRAGGILNENVMFSWVKPDVGKGAFNICTSCKAKEDGSC
ncbi:unnamed protein product [Prunus armeniaca]|uniref:Uncharacterized protein n=1 Tax=Prunus armeniaca TaxID=36596 RepID=A0A6J5Y4F9_PRUAR|nr:unnamed protein product [Prunus armeniaca]CAB4318334.1 unnamed protein product [Prunus armeniaca]